MIILLLACSLIVTLCAGFAAFLTGRITLSSRCALAASVGFLLGGAQMGAEGELGLCGLSFLLHLAYGFLWWTTGGHADVERVRAWRR
jgi:hypothetical protein